MLIDKGECLPILLYWYVWVEGVGVLGFGCVCLSHSLSAPSLASSLLWKGKPNAYVFFANSHTVRHMWPRYGNLLKVADGNILIFHVLLTFEHKLRHIWNTRIGRYLYWSITYSNKLLIFKKKYCWLSRAMYTTSIT